MLIVSVVIADHSGQVTDLECAVRHDDLDKGVARWLWALYGHQPAGANRWRDGAYKAAAG